MKENISKSKSKAFAIKIINLYKYLTDERKENVLSKQLLRSGTSIGANLAESECSPTKKDFVNKIYVALKECNESLYWIDLLHETNFISLSQYTSIKSDCEELKRILQATTKTIGKVE